MEGVKNYFVQSVGCVPKSASHKYSENRHRSHQHEVQRQSRSTVEEDRIDIYNVQQQQLKQSSRPVKPGPPTKPKPNVALSRKSSKKLFLSYKV